MKENCSFQMFTPSATGLVSYNIDINVNIDLVNGVEARYHSVSYNDPQDNALFDDRVQNTPPGRSIRLPPPTTINLELCADFPGYEANLRNGQGAVEEIEKNASIAALKKLKLKCGGFLKRIGTRHVSIDEDEAILSK